MLFGLCNDCDRIIYYGECAQRHKDNVPFVDDVVVAGPTVPEAVRRLELVFDRLCGVNLNLKPAKFNCSRRVLRY
jgi:hypothetical protein